MKKRRKTYEARHNSSIRQSGTYLEYAAFVGIASLSVQHSVRIFLMNEGVEIGDIANTEHFDVSKKLGEFKKLRGQLHACGTCLELRRKGKNAACPASTMKDLVKIVEESDKVLVFG